MTKVRPDSVLHVNWQRTMALVRKESLQISRDPSTILIAFVLPVVLLFLFAFAVSLDLRQVPLAVVLETDSPGAHRLAAAFSGSPYFAVIPMQSRARAADELVSGGVRGIVVIPQDFARRTSANDGRPVVQVITDGAQPNTAGFVSSYAQGVIGAWQRSESGVMTATSFAIEPRYWFNPELDSRRVLIPGAIAIVMTIIGTLLTALVVAREWERGTMEAMISTPAAINEILIGKLLPYFCLGLATCIVSVLMATLLLGVPLRGSWLALILVSAVFLLPALGQGLLISALTRNQFLASQVALFVGFLPAFLLSGFLFEIDSMPWPIRMLTYAVPARYFVSSLQTVFLAGDVWPLLLPNLFAMTLIGAIFLLFAFARTPKSLE